ncbi:protein LYRIC-like [Acipenser oxyrinchus oxyrinchus]|uniref:Protein LYRIC-like n=1 Tax=Acipenser oxyrinchus oxyrinchus TaxID=40147 RepID=A0AAD8GEA7_ACIOX|nr:protein LYRIC-like [Acipenser oxyrinchus oxyrinchus]
MAARWQDIAAQHADVISSRLRELLSTGLDLLHSKLGVDLGLKPEQYPSWVLLLTAFIGLLVIVVVWAAACVGLCAGRKRGARASDTGSQATKTSTIKNVKGEEQKKKNKKKTVEKKPQNGCTILEQQEDYVKATSEILKQPEMKVEKQIKKTKKTKAGAKQPLHISSGGKEPEDGAWETKISNREKKQQRRRDKVTEDSSLPETQGIVATEHPTSLASVPVLRKIKGEPVRMKPRKGEAIISQVSASWNEAPAVNGGGWNDMAMKLPTQMSGGNGETWTAITKAAAKRNPEPAWGQELEGTGEVGPRTTIADLQLESSQAKIDDQWSGTNGLSTEDPSSDWNAPTEEWGNWDEQNALPLPELVGPATEVQKVSDDDKEKVDSAAAASGKSKKKKKKKKQGEDGSAPVQVTNIETGEPEKEPSSELEVPNSEPEMALPEEATRAIEPVKVEVNFNL